MPADLEISDNSVTAVDDRLDAALASGAQGIYTPTWTKQSREGWNGENFSFLDGSGTPRLNFRLRPYPRLTPGLPLPFAFDEARLPERGPGLGVPLGPLPQTR
jgi:endoglycosylceramidase